jgi:dipeptidyl-peptidase-4
MHVYGGPGSQTAADAFGEFDYWWHQLLAQKGYIVVSVDNRGTGGRGAEFKKIIYQQLGKYETIDQIEAAKWLATQSYVDAERIGIWGWSYGGYMSSLCILKGNDVFKTAIAVAPVTNWKWYDTIYTERYMRTEEENPSGYADNSPVYFADQLKGNYLIVHGLADDNVHFQNTTEMINALVMANKHFDMYIYPNRNHGIYGGSTRLHLYNKMTGFLLEKL